MKSILKLEELAMLAVSVYALLAGIILFGHSSMDRTFGYGLKLNEGFKFMHLE